MKQTYQLEELDCAHCAAKMQEAIAKIDGVESVVISFLQQKMVLEADESKLDAIVKEANSIIKKIEPDCCIVGVTSCGRN